MLDAATESIAAELGPWAVRDDEPANQLVVHVLIADEPALALVAPYGSMIRLDPLLVPVD